MATSKSYSEEEDMRRGEAESPWAPRLLTRNADGEGEKAEALPPRRRDARADAAVAESFTMFEG